jgi:hypothetical protein
MPTAAEIQTRIDNLEAQIAAFAGIKATSFGDQTTTFDLDGAHKELARLRAQLAQAESTPTTRFAAFSKGL